MKIERKKDKNVSVFTASLNDIMFFLLMFFLIISTMVTSSVVRVALPNASAAENVAIKRAIHVTITDDLRYFIDNNEVQFEQIEPELRQTIESKKGDEELNVILRADKNLMLQEVINVINIGYKLNIRMTLFAEKD